MHMLLRMLFFACTLVASSVSKPPKILASHDEQSAMAQKAFEYTNQFRMQRGLAPVTWHQAVADAAYGHSVNMGLKKVPFGHTGFKERAKLFPYRCVAENVYKCNMRGDTAKLAVDSWIASPGHLKNLVGDYTHCGIGVYQNADGYWYFTQMFMRF